MGLKLLKYFSSWQVSVFFFGITLRVPFAIKIQRFWFYALFLFIISCVLKFSIKQRRHRLSKHCWYVLLSFIQFYKYFFSCWSVLLVHINVQKSAKLQSVNWSLQWNVIGIPFLIHTRKIVGCICFMCDGFLVFLFNALPNLQTFNYILEVSENFN